MKNPAIAQIEELERLELEWAREYEIDAEGYNEGDGNLNGNENDEDGRIGYTNEMHQRAGDKGARRNRARGKAQQQGRRVRRPRLSPEDVEELRHNEKVTAFLDQHFSKFVVFAALLCCIPVIFGVYDLIFGVEYEPPKKEGCIRTFAPPQNSFCTEVDLVYTWVNGSDPKLHSDYVKYAKQRATAEAAAGVDGDEDDFDNDEGPLLREMPTLRYSIRAADTYAPWIRRIWIVTNGQVPSWLNVSNPRVRVVTHAEIFPNASDLPTFNSNAIEANLHRIPGLAQCWFYQNDDFGFGRPVCLGDFLDVESGRQRLAFDTFYAPDYRAMAKNTWHKSIGYSNLLLNSHYYADTTFVHGHFYEGHNTRLFRTDVLKTMAQRWAAQYANTSSHRFRDSCDIALPFLYNNVVLTEYGGIKDRDLFGSFLYEKIAPSQKSAEQIVAKIRAEKPLSWCINDGAGRASDEAKRESIAKAVRTLEEELEKWLPVPSDLELGSGEWETIPVTEAQENELKKKKMMSGKKKKEEEENGSWAKILGPWFAIFVIVWALALGVYTYRVYKVCRVLLNDFSKIRTV